MASNRLPVISAAVSAASSGANTAVAAVTARRIRVHQLALIAAGTVTAQFKTAAAGANLTGAMSLIAGVPLVLPYSERGWFDTVAGDLLNLNLGGAVQVSGVIGYSAIP